MSSPLHTVVIFERFGPYHLARLRGASSYMTITGMEIAGRSATYAWERLEAHDLTCLTLFPDRDALSLSSDTIRTAVSERLSELRPDAVAVPGWSHPAALAALQWCRDQDIPAVLMSESSAHDFDRQWWSEMLKRQVVSFASAGLVGGRTHRAYLADLGMDEQHVFLGYDVVDNDHFAQESEADQKKVSQSSSDLPERYFLASSRFVPKKNLPGLIRAFADYRAQAPAETAWDLVLLGDGDQRPVIESAIEEEGLRETVHLPGFVQYPDLPSFYKRASGFVHASTREQWGLVVNEAMAAGLPVIVSDRCGCAPELVREGVNGWTFDPSDLSALTRCFITLAHGSANRRAMGQESLKVIRKWGPERFGEGLSDAVEASFSATPPAPSFARSLVLNVLQRR